MSTLALLKTLALVALHGVCGDGVIEDDESCDDGGPTAYCTAECQPVLCGDGLSTEAAQETCDPPAAGLCAPNCTLEACGNGHVEGAEACDRGVVAGQLIVNRPAPVGGPAASAILEGEGGDALFVVEEDTLTRFPLEWPQPAGSSWGFEQVGLEVELFALAGGPAALYAANAQGFFEVEVGGWPEAEVSALDAPLSAALVSMGVSPDGRYLYFTVWDSNAVHYWDFETSAKGSLEAPETLFEHLTPHIAVAPDGRVWGSTSARLIRWSPPEEGGALELEQVLLEYGSNTTIAIGAAGVVHMVEHGIDGNPNRLRRFDAEGAVLPDLEPAWLPVAPRWIEAWEGTVLVGDAAWTDGWASYYSQRALWMHQLPNGHPLGDCDALCGAAPDPELDPEPGPEPGPEPEPEAEAEAGSEPEAEITDTAGAGDVDDLVGRATEAELSADLGSADADGSVAEDVGDVGDVGPLPQPGSEPAIPAAVPGARTGCGGGRPPVTPGLALLALMALLVVSRRFASGR